MMTGNVVQLRKGSLQAAVETYLETFQCPVLAYDSVETRFLAANGKAREILGERAIFRDDRFANLDLPFVKATFGGCLPPVPVKICGRSLEIHFLSQEQKTNQGPGRGIPSPNSLAPLFQNLPLPAFTVDGQGRLLDRNSAFMDLFGEKLPRSAPCYFPDLLPEEHRLTLKQHMWGTALKAVFTADLRLPGVEGARRDFRLHGQTLIDPEGEVAGFLFVLEDREDLKQLKKADRFLEVLFERSPLPLLYAEGLKVSRANAACCTLFGYEHGEFRGAPIPERVSVPAKDTEVIPQCLAQVRKGESLFREMRFRRKDGTHFDALVLVVPLGIDNGKHCTLSFIQENGQKKQMEQLLMRNALVVEQSPLVLFQGVRCPEGLRLNYVSQNIRKFGYSPESFGSFEDRVHPEDLPVIRQTIASSPEKKDRELTYRLKTASGEDRWVRERNRTFHSSGAETVVGLIEDISDQVKTQEEIRRNHHQLRERLCSLEKSWEQTIELLAAVTELRDPYTMGHQRRVAHLAGELARELGMGAVREHEIVRAGLVHDIGKIQIPSDILSRPGKLGEHEFALIKQHTVVGARLLETIDLPWPLHSIVRQHHERTNGSGYPDGLKGNEILPAARIIAVADVIEAMATHRPYRPALGIGAALGEVENNAGILYDKDVVQACLKLFREKGYTFPES